MNAKERESLVRRLVEPVAAGRADVDASIFTDDVVWYASGLEGDAAEHRGVAAVVALLNSLVVMGLKVEILDVLTGGEMTASVQRNTAVHNGRTLDLTVVNLFRFRGDKIAEIRGFFSEPQQLAGFWSIRSHGDLPPR
jgi:ketosteroid isomerase-like protein